jgi:drug/metabolite transporter (DMT)-like permease
VKHILGGVNYALINLFYNSKAHFLNTDRAVKIPTDDLPRFKKSFFIALLSFISGWVVMLPIFLVAYAKQRKSIKLSQPLKIERYSLRACLPLFLPAAFDWIAVSLSLTGNKWTPAFVVVVVKSTRILNSTLLSKIFLKRSYKIYQYLAICMAVLGVAIVSIGNVLHKNDQKEPGHGAAELLMGMSFVLIAEFLRASKAVYEENLMKQKLLCPKFIAVVEGIICTVLSLITIILVHCCFNGPEHDQVKVLIKNDKSGSFENSLNTLEFIQNSRRVQFFTFHNAVTTGFISYFGLLVTKYLSAVHSAMWSEMRVLIVWSSELAIYHIVKHWNQGIPIKGDGEDWNSYSWISLIGFVFLISSGLVFNKVIRIPGLAKYYTDQVKVVVNDPVTA